VPGVKVLTLSFGRSKYSSEVVLEDVVIADQPIQAGGSPLWRCGTSIPSAANPQPPGTIGEDPRQEPTNLFPVIAQIL
jgi:UDP-glucose 4-epimerase